MKVASIYAISHHESPRMFHSGCACMDHAIQDMDVSEAPKTSPLARSQLCLLEQGHLTTRFAIFVKWISARWPTGTPI